MQEMISTFFFKSTVTVHRIGMADNESSTIWVDASSDCYPNKEPFKVTIIGV